MNDSCSSVDELVILTHLLPKCAALTELHIRYRHTHTSEKCTQPWTYLTSYCMIVHPVGCISIVLVYVNNLVHESNSQIDHLTWVLQSSAITVCVCFFIFKTAESCPGIFVVFWWEGNTCRWKMENAQVCDQFKHPSGNQPKTFWRRDFIILYCSKWVILVLVIMTVMMMKLLPLSV